MQKATGIEACCHKDSLSLPRETVTLLTDEKEMALLDVLDVGHRALPHRPGALAGGSELCTVKL